MYGGLSHGQSRIAMKKKDMKEQEEPVKKLEKAFSDPDPKAKAYGYNHLPQNQSEKLLQTCQSWKF